MRFKGSIWYAKADHPNRPIRITNQWGLTVNWDCNTANVHDTVFHPVISRYEEEMILLSDQGFHAKTKDPANLKVCPAKT